MPIYYSLEYATNQGLSCVTEKRNKTYFFYSNLLINEYDCFRSRSIGKEKVVYVKHFKSVLNYITIVCSFHKKKKKKHLSKTF